MNTFKTTTLSLVAATAIALTGCGGGGSSSTTTTPPVGPSYTYTQAIVAESATTPTIDTTTLAAGTLTGVINLSADTVYELTGLVKIHTGAILNIEAGTTIIGNDGAYIVVLKGATINANGTEASPITFTSKTAYNGGVAESGQWGGLTILGEAPTNQTDPHYEVDEADPDFAFGGTIPADNSGVLRYVNILNSGSVIGTDVEINGLSLCGVGSGTVVENIAVVNSSDDGVEVWGGTVNMSYLTIVGAEDDSLDLDFGYSGTVDGVTVAQTEVAHAGFEISSGGDAPMTEATIKNFSITKVNGSDEGGIYIKDDETAPTFINGAVFVQSADAALNVRKAMLIDQINTISFDEVLLHSATRYDGEGAAQIEAELEN